jgi:LysM repeat protein
LKIGGKKGFSSTRAIGAASHTSLIRAYRAITIGLVSGAVLSTSPYEAHAGIFSLLESLVAPTAVFERHVSDQKNSQSMALLSAALNQDPNPSKGGGDITIVGDSALLPDIGPSGTAANLPDRILSDQISIYVVREGDSISGIAAMFGVSASTIIWANDLSASGAIKPGETLTILPISGVRHAVRAGDTVSSIAKKYGGSEAEILSYNGLAKDARLAVGDTVIIPDGEVAAVVHRPARPARPSSGASGGTALPFSGGFLTSPVAGGVLTQGLHGYNAVDIGAPVGTPVAASAAGKVIVARNSGWNGGYGNYIVVEHENGVQTLYSHLSRVIAGSGNRVVQGEVLGYVGTTGKTTGPHLHFEVRGAANPFAR